MPALLLPVACVVIQEPKRGPQELPSPGAVPPESRLFASVHGPLGESLSAESYLLTRSRHEPGGLVVRQGVPIRSAPAAAQGELDAVLLAFDELLGRAAANSSPEGASVLGREPARVAPASATETDETDESRASRVFELAVADRFVADLAITDRNETRARVELRFLEDDLPVAALNAELPELLAFLRERSLEGIHDDMARPRRALDAHYLALLPYLGCPGLDAATRGALRGEMREYLLSRRDAGKLAVHLFEHLDAFGGEEFATAFAEETDLGLRLLALTEAARGGDRAKLAEIVTLALEYHGEGALFRAALGALFPAHENADLYASAPRIGRPPQVGELFEAVRAGLDSASPLPKGGWRLR